MLKRVFSRSNVDAGCEDIHHSCSIFLLDDLQPLSLSYGKNTEGQVLFEQVCGVLKLLEQSYFGLWYYNINKEKRWVNLSKTIHQQLKDLKLKVLYFRIRYYPSDPSKLQEDITRYYLFLQVRRDLSEGRLLCPVEDAIFLAAHIVHYNGVVLQTEEDDVIVISPQEASWKIFKAEYGDAEIAEDIVTSIKLMPQVAYDHATDVVILCKALHGQTQGEVEENFLKIASHLNAYGIDPQDVQDETGLQVQIGVSYLGISAFHNLRCSSLLNWSEITRLGYEGKYFIVFNTNAERNKVPCKFKCWSSVACRHLWKYAVDQQQFYTLESSSRAVKVQSSRKLLRRHSTYRFRGKSEVEVISAGASIKRVVSDFRRSSVSLYSAPSSFDTQLSADVRTNGALLNESLNTASVKDLISEYSTENDVIPEVVPQLRRNSVLLPVHHEDSLPEARDIDSDVDNDVDDEDEVDDEVDQQLNQEISTDSIDNANQSTENSRLRRLRFVFISCAMIFLALVAVAITLFCICEAFLLNDWAILKLRASEMSYFESLHSLLMPPGDSNSK